MKRVRGDEERARKLRRSVQALDAALRERERNLAAREEEIDARRADVERLRRRLEGVF